MHTVWHMVKITYFLAEKLFQGLLEPVSSIVYGKVCLWLVALCLILNFNVGLLHEDGK